MIHILCEIDTNAITYPIDARQRQRSIPVLSHIPRGQNTSDIPCTPHRTPQTQGQKYIKFLSK